MKKVLATILALVMAIGLCSVSWAVSTELPQADGNGVITLTDDVVLAAGKEINKEGTTQVTKIDLGGHKLSRAGGFVLDIYGDVTITNGTIEMTGAQSGSAIWINNGAKVTIDNSVKVSATGSVNNKTSFAIAFDSSCDDAALTFNGAIAGENGVTINGNITKTTNKISVNGTIDVAGHALYLAGNGTTNISNGACVKGDAGIEIRAGVLNINGGTVESTGTYSVPSANGNGTTASGAALIVAEHTTNQGITVNVNSGNIKAASAGKAIAVSDPQNTNGNDVKLNVAGGNVVGGIQVEESIETAKPVAVTGGTFSSRDVSGYVADNTPFAFNERTNEPTYYVGAETIQNAAKNLSAGQWLAIGKGNVTLRDVPAGVIVRPVNDTVGVVVNGKNISGNQYIDGYTVPQSSGYYYYQPTTDTKADDTKGSPKTFDAGVGIYAVTAVLSVTGMAWTAKKRGN